MPKIPKGYPNEISDDALAGVVDGFRGRFEEFPDAIHPSLMADLLTIGLNEMARRRDERLARRILYLTALGVAVAVVALVVSIAVALGR